MTPEEFYQRIDQEREEMSLAAFLGEFEDITPKMIGQFRCTAPRGYCPQ